ncbi:MAG TPA: HU family DNA-binding protein, partial [Firmicutes bacterium]|nr:HU family DNA-binding protein [Bacillota bacterium]
MSDNRYSAAAWPEGSRSPARWPRGRTLPAQPTAGANDGLGPRVSSCAPSRITRQECDWSQGSTRLRLPVYCLRAFGDNIVGVRSGRGEKVTKAELVAAVAQKTGFKKVDADKAVDAVFEAIRELSQGGAVAVTGFGKFASKERGPKKGRNIRTGEAIVVPPR